MKKNGFKIGVLFAGAGGFDLGFRYAGYSVEFAIDNMPDACSTYNKNSGSDKISQLDLLQVDPKDYLKYNIDALIGSPPCQNLSQANTSKKLQDALKFINVFDRWITIISPKIWILENVSGIEQHLKPSLYPIRNLLNSYDYGVPQKRERCFAGFYKKPDITCKRALSDIFTSDEINKREIKNNIYYSENPSHYLRQDGPFLKKHPPFLLNQPARTITSKKDNHPVLLKDKTLRHLLPDELARIQTFPQNYEFIGSESSQYLQIGNAVPPLLAYEIAKAQLSVLRNEITIPIIPQEASLFKYI